MTRQEFIDDVTSWSELIEFCSYENLDYCNDVYDNESYNDEIDSELSERAEDDSWQDVRDWLSSLPNGYDYYIKDDYGDWYAADDDDFDSRKDEVIECMDDGGYWDEYDEEEEPEEYIDPEDEVPVEKEDVSFAELFTTCSSQVQKLESDKIADAVATEQAEATAFDELCVSVGITVTVEGSN